MVTLDEKKYNSLKSDKSTIILSKYGTYRVQLKDNQNQFFLSVYKNEFTVSSTSYQIYFHLDIPILEDQDKEQVQINFLRTLYIVNESTEILIDNGNFKNSYSYNLEFHKNVVYIKLNEKPTEDYEIISPELVCQPALIN